MDDGEITQKVKRFFELEGVRIDLEEKLKEVNKELEELRKALDEYKEK